MENISKYNANLIKTFQLIEASRILKKAFIRAKIGNVSDAELNDAYFRGVLNRKELHGIRPEPTSRVP